MYCTANVSEFCEKRDIDITQFYIEFNRFYVTNYIMLKNTKKRPLVLLAFGGLSFYQSIQYL